MFEFGQWEYMDLVLPKGHYKAKIPVKIIEMYEGVSPLK